MLWLLPWKSEDENRHLPLATWTLMALNILVFFVTRPVDDGAAELFFRAWGLPSMDWHWYQWLTSKFLHGDLMHLGGNMLFLWIFGDAIEDALGPLGFLGIYFLGGVFGSLLYVYGNESAIPSVGASGCIAAVAGAYAVLFWNRSVRLKVVLLVFPLWTWAVPAFLVVLFYFGADVWATMRDKGALGEGGGVNFVVHGAGFAFGFAMAVLARFAGAMARYDELDNGSGWWGYLPASLEQDAQRAKRKRQRTQRALEDARRSAGVP